MPQPFPATFAARRFALAAACLLGAVLGTPGCDGDDGGDDGEQPLPRCVEVDTACAPLYQPVYDEIYTRTLVAKCATGGGSCHASGDALGAADNGLAFVDADASHALLTQDRGDDTFVAAGDPGCSGLMVRLTIDDAVRGMPPGAPLAEGERCTIAQWIEAGAPR
ncbi:MAG: hypothetical protein K1X88_13690 [Nannocystaceae bacterium]|nr:hypothetical protein [Nannocystaceae bacterium]